MTNKKLAEIVGGIVMAIMALVVLSAVAMGGPKVGDSGGVLVVCNSPEVIEKIFRGGSDEVSITLYNEAREDGSCVQLPSPVLGEITKIITSFVDHNGDKITIVEIDGVVYTFTSEKTTET